MREICVLQEYHLQAIARVYFIEQEVDVLTHRLVVLVVRLNGNYVLALSHFGGAVFIVKILVSVLIPAGVREVGATKLV